jgi:hypothetical protein
VALPLFVFFFLSSELASFADGPFLFLFASGWILDRESIAFRLDDVDFFSFSPP